MLGRLVGALPCEGKREKIDDGRDADEEGFWTGLIAVAYGVIADVTTRSERGGYCGVFDLLLVLLTFFLSGPW